MLYNLRFSYRVMRLLTLLLFIVTSFDLKADSSCEPPLYSCANFADLEAGDPRLKPLEDEVKIYLKSLTKKDLNTRLAGFKLKTDKVIFKNWTLIHLNNSNKKHLIALKNTTGTIYSFIWMDTGKFTYPKKSQCTKEFHDCTDQNEPTSIIDGEVHTYGEVSKDIIVFPYCAHKCLEL